MIRNNKKLGKQKDNITVMKDKKVATSKEYLHTSNKQQVQHQTDNSSKRKKLNGRKQLRKENATNLQLQRGSSIGPGLKSTANDIKRETENHINNNGITPTTKNIKKYTKNINTNNFKKAKTKKVHTCIQILNKLDSQSTCKNIREKGRKSFKMNQQSTKQ